MSELVGIERDGSVATLTLRRGERKNALSIALRDAVADVLAQLAADEAAKVIVVTGTGTTFSAGFDLQEFQRLDEPEFARQLWDSSDRFHRALLECPLPTVAAVNGPALAGGFDLAVLCDLRVAAETAYFAHVEHTFGDVVYAPLHDLVGGAVARELCLTGRRVEAREALSLRLVSAVVPADQLTAEAQRWATRIAAAPRHLLARTRAKIIDRAAIRFRTTLDL